MPMKTEGSSARTASRKAWREARGLMTIKEAVAWCGEYLDPQLTPAAREHLMGGFTAYISILVETGHLPMQDKRYMTRKHLIEALQIGREQQDIFNPPDSPHDAAIQDFLKCLPFLNSTYSFDELQPVGAVIDAANAQMGVGPLDRESIARSLLQREDTRRNEALQNTLRAHKRSLGARPSLKPTHLAHKYKRANQEARREEQAWRARKWINEHVVHILKDPSINLRILDRALANNPEAHTLRVVYCLDKGFDPASTPDAPIRQKDKSWAYREAVLRRYNISWVDLSPQDAWASYSQTRKVVRRLHFRELELSVQRLDLHLSVFGLPTRNDLRLVGPRVVNKRRTMNLALQTPTIGS
jgi:hypothetical protein